ncbi:Uncharacterized protein FWK35_00020432 [Aphis craccivora]|uniref:Uncharacterized protein n=1 Tax=Aphis craccivora TaxID=307492 RepID=A0A6G0XZY7_APHCR|nr:Uncharacterized protein FWK35_00020432 [Aphis craccivora]
MDSTVKVQIQISFIKNIIYFIFHKNIILSFDLRINLIYMYPIHAYCLIFQNSVYNSTAIVLDSERSDECIDFTMMCAFFVSVYSITSRNNASTSNYLGSFRRKNEYPWCIVEVKMSIKCFWPNQNMYLKMHNFFLLAFEVQILTKIRQNHEYLQFIFLYQQFPNCEARAVVVYHIGKNFNCFENIRWSKWLKISGRMPKLYTTVILLDFQISRKLHKNLKNSIKKSVDLALCFCRLNKMI